MPTRRFAGLTLVEVLVVVVGLTSLGALGLAAEPRVRVNARGQKDSTQVRGIQQAMIVWASNNQSIYPMPSRISGESNDTVPAGVAKDLPRYVYSLMIFNGSISPELCVSPGEVHEQITVFGTYEYSNPSAAPKPQNALWDPAFRAYPMDEDGPEKPNTKAGASYALMAFLGKRAKMWQDTYNSTEPALGWRGPAYDLNPGSPTSREWVLAPRSETGRSGVGSNRLLFPGTGHGWCGNVSFNDNHVELLTRPDPPSVVMTRSNPKPNQPRTIPDNIFVNENDATGDPDPEDLVGSDNRNAFLATWGRASVDDHGAMKDLSKGLWWD